MGITTAKPVMVLAAMSTYGVVDGWFNSTMGGYSGVAHGGSDDGTSSGANSKGGGTVVENGNVMALAAAQVASNSSFIWVIDFSITASINSAIDFSVAVVVALMSSRAMMRFEIKAPSWRC